MNNEILTRLVYALLIILAGLALYRAANWLILFRARMSLQPSQAAVPSTPSILYFTTPDCAPCKTIQRPAIEKLKESMGDRLTVVEINAYEKPELAKQWGVMSVPTTFVLDAHGTPRHVNHGATPASKLMRQVSDVMEDFSI
ncbi:MAG: thioredoxin family protein [Anaerolineae bacterium]|nr:thioredoxin family protein [Anaerolineae bacterium]